MFKTHFILYVADQERSTTFYSYILSLEPHLNVPGMTEFQLDEKTVLGLMPQDGAARLLGESVGDPPLLEARPRGEVYLVVDDPQEYHRRAISSGAREISVFSERDWGHRAAYSIDADGYVLAFAEVI